MQIRHLHTYLTNFMHYLVFPTDSEFVTKDYRCQRKIAYYLLYTALIISLTPQHKRLMRLQIIVMTLQYYHLVLYISEDKRNCRKHGANRFTLCTG